MRRISFLVPALFLATLLTACADGKVTLRSFEGDKSVTVKVEIADSATERASGLMERASLAADTGMLFVFPKPQPLAFWMKNTLIPLEVIFFDGNGDFVNALSMTPCKDDPCPQYKAAALAQYALETNPGFRKDHGIGVGWKIDLATVKKNAKPR